MSNTQAPLTANNSGFTAIKTQTPCSFLLIRETGNGATTRFSIASPTNSSGPATYATGEPCRFIYPGTRGKWPAGFTVGFIELLDVASAQFDVLEDIDVTP